MLLTRPHAWTLHNTVAIPAKDTKVQIPKVWRIENSPQGPDMFGQLTAWAMALLRQVGPRLSSEK